MADNVTLNTGSGGDVIAADDDTTAKHQYVKVEFGGDGVFTKVESTAGLPITGDGTPLPVSGTVTETNSTAILADTAAMDTNLATLAGAVAGTEMQVDIVSGSVTGTGDWTVIGSDAENAAVTKAPVLTGGRYDAAARTLGDGDVGALAVNTSGILKTAPGNVISTNNTSTATLGISATFTGTGDDVSQFTTVTCYVDSSHDSATDGMSFQFSNDNTNWDVSHDFSYTAANGGRQFQFPVVAQYFRVSYTNGGTGQTTFRLQTIHHAESTLTSIHQLSDDVHPDRSSQIVKAAVIAQNAGTGDYKSIQATAGGNLKVAIEEISDGLDIGAGNAGTETQRVSIATDDVNLAAINTNTTASTSHYRNIDANAEAAIKVSAGILYWVHCMNMTAAVAYLHLYDDTTGNVIPGTTVPDYTFPIATQGDTNGAGFTISLGANGQSFTTAITLVCTTTIDGSTGDPGTNGVFVNAGYE